MTTGGKNSAALERFLASMRMTYEKWHDGEGYDLKALAQIKPDEREALVQLLAEGAEGVTWREIEALAAIDLPSARAAIVKAMDHPMRIDTRVAAAEALHAQGSLPDVDAFLARQIRQLERMENGLTPTLLMAEAHPTEVVKQALLWASWNRTECAPHCAGLLCYLCGVAKEPFDWDLRSLFLQLGPHVSYFEREAAFKELCAKVKMELNTQQ